MSNVFYKTILAIALSGITVSAYARPDFDGRLDRHPTRNQEKPFHASGVLRCENKNHVDGKTCDLSFTRISDKEKIRVETNSELAKLHCDDHKDAKITVLGRYTMRSIFGNDQIKVESFENMKKISAEDVQRLLGSNNTNRRQRRSFTSRSDHEI